MHFSILFVLLSFSQYVFCTPTTPVQPRFFNLGDLGSLTSSLNSSEAAGLTAFLGEGDSVIFQNQVLDALNATDSCAAMTVLFARGTDEPGDYISSLATACTISKLTEVHEIGNVGILVGPPFFAAIAEYMNGTGQLAIQGVDYDASIAGFLEGGSPQGATTMSVPSCFNVRSTISEAE